MTSLQPNHVSSPENWREEEKKKKKKKEEEEGETWRREKLQAKHRRVSACVPCLQTCTERERERGGRRGQRENKRKRSEKEKEAKAMKIGIKRERRTR